MPKVSVVIPTYNVEKYIERCVRSLFEQTLDSMEYIFVDDCSPDNSIAIMQKVLEEYPQRKDQVKIIRHEVNQGVGAARNHGVAACTGDYIIHCDPDDWVDLNMYETMYNKAIETNADMVYCDFYESSAKRDIPIMQLGTCEPEKLINEFLSGKTHSALWNKIFKRDIVLNRDLYCPNHIIMCEDLLRTTQMLTKCHKISYINQSFYFYRYNFSSYTKEKSSPQKVDNICEVYDFFIKTLSPDHKDIAETMKLVLAIQSPRAISNSKFCLAVQKYGKEKIKNTLPLLPRGRKSLLKLALINYHLARIAYKSAKSINCFIKKLLKHFYE